MTRKISNVKAAAEREAAHNKAMAEVERTNGLPIVQLPGESASRTRARVALKPSIHTTLIMQSCKTVVDEQTSLAGILEGLDASIAQVHDGDLASAEAMLVGQAASLQALFTHFVLRAQRQEGMRNLEALMGLALKAQAQSRATISALVDLKYPRQATFVKQANIAQGNQQVNNGVPGSAAASIPQAAPPHQLEAPTVAEVAPVVQRARQTIAREKK